MKYVLVLVLSLFALPAMAQEGRTGFVDVQKLFQDSPVAKQANETLQRERAKLQAELDEADAAVKKAEAAKEKPEQVKVKRDAAARLHATNQESLDRLQKEVVAGVDASIVAAATKAANEKHLTVVWPLRPLFAKGVVDLTEDVQKRLTNSDPAKEAAAAKLRSENAALKAELEALKKTQQKK